MRIGPLKDVKVGGLLLQDIWYDQKVNIAADCYLETLIIQKYLRRTNEKITVENVRYWIEKFTCLFAKGTTFDNRLK